MLVGQQHELLVSGPPADPNMYHATILSSGEPDSLVVEAMGLGWADSRKGAALALVVWDALLTLDDEVNYIWSSVIIETTKGG